MNFEDFIKIGQVKKSSPDKQLIKSIIELSKSDLLFLRKVKVDENSSRKIMGGYYDVLRSILEAIASKNGYKIYSHEAFTYFLRKIDEPIISDKFERFRKIRNGINYYGKSISPKEVSENILEIDRIISYLLGKHLEKI